MSQLAVHLDGLRKDFAGEKALKGLRLDIESGSLFGVIGADGAGKTTLMRILATLLDADGGDISLLGLNPKTEYVALRQRIGYMPQRFSLYADLSVRENMEFFATLFGLSAKERKDRMDSLLAFANLTEFTERRAGALSGGMKQKLALSCILLHEPDLLLLDEPTVGVDPVARRDFWKLLKTLRDEGRTIVVSTPYMDEAEMCSSLALMHQGELLALGSPHDLTSAYPLPMLTVRSTAPLRWPLSRPCPSPFGAIYPMGGELHAVLALPSEDRSMTAGEAPQSASKPTLNPTIPLTPSTLKQAQQTLESALELSVQTEVIAAGIEDVFLGLLSGAIDKSLYQVTVQDTSHPHATSSDPKVKQASHDQALVASRQPGGKA